MSVEPLQPTLIRVLVVDDEPLLRSSLRMILDAQEDMTVVAEAATGPEAVVAAQHRHPDVILMDIRMPRGDGIRATSQITSNPDLGDTRIIVLTMFELDEYVYGALRAGASGFLLKDAQPAALITAIRRVFAGEALFAPSVLRRLVRHYVDAPPSALVDQGGRDSPAPRSEVGGGVRLTVRESEILALIGQGLSNGEITAELCLSMNTVKTHISNLLAKLHARDRAQLVIAAYRRGLVER